MMAMQEHEILASNATKTAKIQALLALGLSRKEVAALMGVGYGWVQNIFARLYPERVRSRRVIDQVIAEFNFRFTRTLGVELEMFGTDRARLVAELQAIGIECHDEYYNHSTRSYWKIVNDGSIQGNDALELVSPVLQGEEGLAELRRVCQILNRIGSRQNRSCGFHAHHSFEDIGEDITIWRNLFHNYATLEPLIDGFMPASRRGDANIYCRSMRVADWAQKIESATNLRGMEMAVTRTCRYFKLNVQAYWRHKTAEFRQHSGTIEFEKIANWVLFTSRLIDFSKTNRVAAGTFEEMARFATPEMITFFKSRARQLRVAA